MRCLHCGSTLSAFKKLTDSGFCSTEHRDQFYTEQQKLIIERLKQSGTRFHRLRRGGAGEPARPAVNVEPQVVEVQAPAKIAAFLAMLAAPQDRLLCLQWVPQVNPELAPANPPERKHHASVRQLLAALIPDFPWARYNPGLLACGSVELVDFGSDIAHGSIFELNGSVTLGFAPLPLISTQRTEAKNIPSRTFYTIRMTKPKPRISLSPVRLVRAASRYAVTPAGYLRFVDLTPSERSVPECVSKASPIEISAGLAISASLRIRDGQQARGLAFLDLVFRMRPRTGVLPAGLPSSYQITCEPLPTTTGPSRPRDLSGAVHGRPSPSDRFLRTRPRSAVDSAALYRKIVPAERAIEPRPGIPGFEAQVPELSPASVQGTLRMKVSAVSGGNTEEFATGGALTLESSPVNPGLAFGAGCAPLLLDRFYRPRPRGPVFDDGLAVMLGSDSAPNGFVSQPTVCELGKPSLAFEPSLSERLFRMRPRTGVGSESIAGLNPSTSPEQLVSQPATPALAVKSDASPSRVTRMYKMRPSAGVDGKTASFRPPSLTPANAAASADYAIAKFLPAPAELTPPVQRRFFRVRSAAAIGVDTVKATEAIAASQDMAQLPPAIVGFVSQKHDGFEPRLVDRLFRGRPKLGPQSCPDFAPNNALSQPFVCAPAVPSIGLGDCSPNAVVRLYRFRPKSAVDSKTALFDVCTAVLDFPQGRTEFSPDWWDVISGPKPLFVNRMYRMRLKQPAEDTDTLTQPIKTKHLPVPDPEPVLATLPPPPVAAAPSFLNRLYRMRPKSGKAPAPSANSIPCNALEPRPHAGAPAAMLQSISKHWKAAPLSAKSIAAILPLLFILLLLPVNLPSRAADGSRFRQAIANRAAIERADDFAGGLTNWEGVEKWKPTPSGMMQPVGLGLFKPSLELQDYRMAFSGQIVKQALGFVVRAKDARNYQAVKLVTLKPGPLPTVAVVRYAFIDGKESNRKQTVLPMTVTADTVYRICMDVADQSFTLMVQGKVVDFWQEERLKNGGAGFFSAKGEQALIQNIRISHQDDAIGRLFAALPLQNVEASNGSGQRR